MFLRGDQVKRIIFMGAVGCGKTTLSQALQNEKIEYNKTQAVEFYPEIIDTPGEFILHRHYYNALTVSAADAQMIGFVQSVQETEQVFSPGFGAIFPKQIIGIVTKTDLAENPEQIRRIRDELTAAGAERIFEVSAFTDEGVAELKKYIEDATSAG